MVPTDAPGFQVESAVRLFGHAGGHEGALVLEDVKVEPWQLVGSLDEEFKDRALRRLAGAGLQFCARSGVSGRFLPARSRCYRTARCVSDGAQCRVSNGDFPLGRGIQMSVGSGAQTHVIYGQVEPGMIHYHQGLRRALNLTVDAHLPAAAE